MLGMQEDDWGEVQSVISPVQLSLTRGCGCQGVHASDDGKGTTRGISIWRNLLLFYQITAH